MVHDELEVFLNEIPIGILAQDNGALSFHYHREYLALDTAYRLSQNLPLEETIYVDPVVENFFSNLLPDEKMRLKIAAVLGTSPENTFGLLKRIGADCAGAVSFYPRGTAPQSPEKPVYRTLSDEEAYNILDNLDERPLDAGDEGVRISGAGSQEKLVACLMNGKVALPLYGTPSTHIIKPMISGVSDSVHNEFFCMKLAKRCNIPVAECELLSLCSENFYAVKRFDRTVENGIVRRLHQEDFCQLLNVSPTLKYQEEGGPGIKECLAQMQLLHMPAAGRLHFIRLVFFNFLIGNCDAHAKNYAVLYHAGRPSLAPAYDLLSTMVYDHILKRFAMTIGGENRMGQINRNHFVQMAKECDLNPRLILSELKNLTAELPNQAKNLETELNEDYPSPIYSSITRQIARLCRQANEIL